MTSRLIGEQVRSVLKQIKNLNDTNDQNDIMQLIGILTSLLRMKHVVMPVAEIMCISKHLKPTLYAATRRRITSTSNLHILFQLDMDTNLAISRIEAILHPK
ncbi:hypothetical protein [Brevibacillus sp. SYSU BS000544]|uniref:hypothetical protein n=1 Tax=Brevibacillus sp. SYSU BS000544 TaxID=3416443 RepID=UPI003CE5565A